MGEEKTYVQLEKSKLRLVSNGTLDIHGRIASKDKTGGWRATPFIIVNEVAERLAYNSIAVSIVSYLRQVMHESLPVAATHVTNFVGASYYLTLLGAFLADAYLGRFKTIIIFSCIYAVGLAFLTASASLEGLQPPPCTGNVCTPATDRQSNFLYFALALIALGTGGIKPCVSSFGADQFDEADEKEIHMKFSFFNWFFFAINLGSLVGLTAVVHIEEHISWGLGFGVTMMSTVLSVIVLAAGASFYRYRRPMGSAFTRFLQVIVASLRNHFNGVKKVQAPLYEVESEESDIAGARKLQHTEQYRLLDKASIIVDQTPKSTSRWRLCTVTQVEEFKCFIRVLPVWVTTIAIYISAAQVATFYIGQAKIMNRNIGSFTIPVGSVPLFLIMTTLLLVPLYERFIVPFLRRYTGNKRGITSLQRIGVGLFISIFSTLVAAIVEKKRRDMAPMEMSVFWLAFQYALISSAEVFTYVGQMEFFYDEATDGTRSLSHALYLSEHGLGSWLSSLLVKIIVSTTGGEEKGWLRNDLNVSRLEYFYWLLTGISTVNFLVYLLAAGSYKGKNGVGASVVDGETIGESEVKKDRP